MSIIQQDTLQAMLVSPKLHQLYNDLIGVPPDENSNSAIQSATLLRELTPLFTADLPEKIKTMFDSRPDLTWTIQQNRQIIPFYDNGMGLAIIYFLRRHRNQILRDWPLDREPLHMIATNIGVSLEP